METDRNVSTTLRQPSVEFKLGLLEFSSVLCDGSGSFLTKHSGAFMLKAMTQAHRHTQHGKVWRKKSSASRVLAALASPPATEALDPDLYSRHSLRHAVYAILLHFGVETADGLIQVAIGFAGGSGCFLTKRSGFLLKAPSRVFWRAAWIASV